jgi:feruloyl esterase
MHALIGASFVLCTIGCRGEKKHDVTQTSPAPASPGAAHASPTVASCESLRELALPHVTITEARTVAATEAPAKLPAHCRVLGASHPTPDSDIRFVVVVPTGTAWNGRYQQVGSGGFAGFLPDEDLREGLAAGYAVAGTDDGHDAPANDARWAVGHPEKVVDYAYRALKETSEAARAILRAFTGRAPAHSYFTGCSDGGREALIEAQRFPDDFDGIVSEAPAANYTRLFSAMAWSVAALERTPASFFSSAKLAAIQAAALRACGNPEGVVEDPPACHFDPSSLRCKGAETDACLTEPQLTALRAIYDGMKNPRTGERVYPGFEPGAEAVAGSWSVWFTGPTREEAAGVEARKLGLGFLTSMVLGEPASDFRRIDFDRDVTRARTQLGPILDAVDPNLRPFAKHGKLIVVHGWSDPAIPPRDSIAYYERVRETMGDPRAFYRLFLAPGMIHCGGGPGPNIVPTLDAIVAWVERGVAPDSLIARKHAEDDPTKALVRAWPLCPYPQRAMWDAKGDRSKAESWRCTESARAK